MNTPLYTERRSVSAARQSSSVTAPAMLCAASKQPGSPPQSRPQQCFVQPANSPAVLLSHGPSNALCSQQTARQSSSVTAPAMLCAASKQPGSPPQSRPQQCFVQPANSPAVLLSHGPSNALCSQQTARQSSSVTAPAMLCAASKQPGSPPQSRPQQCFVQPANSPAVLLSHGPSNALCSQQTARQSSSVTAPAMLCAASKQPGSPPQSRPQQCFVQPANSQAVLLSHGPSNALCSQQTARQSCSAFNTHGSEE